MTTNHKNTTTQATETEILFFDIGCATTFFESQIEDTLSSSLSQHPTKPYLYIYSAKLAKSQLQSFLTDARNAGGKTQEATPQ